MADQKQAVNIALTAKSTATAGGSGGKARLTAPVPDLTKLASEFEAIAATAAARELQRKQLLDAAAAARTGAVSAAALAKRAQRSAITESKRANRIARQSEIERSGERRPKGRPQIAATGPAVVGPAGSDNDDNGSDDEEASGDITITAAATTNAAASASTGAPPPRAAAAAGIDIKQPIAAVATAAITATAATAAAAAAGGKPKKAGKNSGGGGASAMRDGDGDGADDPLYDPLMDERDERWVQQQNKKRTPQQPARGGAAARGRRGGGRGGASGGGAASMNAFDDDLDAAASAGAGAGHQSDAVLSCPACFASLCDDCQQHDSYPNHYRAMFVSNCRVVTTETIKPQTDDEPDPNAVFHPVQCESCNTVVAAFDSDEVYHFFNVVSEDVKRNANRRRGAGGDDDEDDDDDDL